jgi:hypothetical protein
VRPHRSNGSRARLITKVWPEKVRDGSVPSFFGDEWIYASKRSSIQPRASSGRRIQTENRFADKVNDGAVSPLNLNSETLKLIARRGKWGSFTADAHVRLASFNLDLRSLVYGCCHGGVLAF